jgi:hypothetical protein
MLFADLIEIEGFCAMSGLKFAPAPSNSKLAGRNGIAHSLLNQKTIELTETNLTEFLRQPRRTRLTGAYELAILAPFELVARSKGQLILAEWLEGISPYRAIHELQLAEPTIDLLQLTLVIGRSVLTANHWRETLRAEKNGRYGLEVMLHGNRARVSPLQTIATNRSLAAFFQATLEATHLTPEEFFAIGGQLSLLECKQFILQCGKSSRAFETYRGNHLIKADQQPVALADSVISGIARWFMSNQDLEGGLPYKYWPSSGTYSGADNPIRRFMATVAFNRMAYALDRQDMKVAARKNLSYNLSRFYRHEGGTGTIAWRGTVKLGSLALAALAILESPFAAAWAEELAQLRRTIDALWQPSGAFRTFLQPADRNDNQNFYPGEALLFWAISLEKERNDALLSRAVKSFYYYRSHFRKNSNPAFVPWHSQAALILYRLTGDTAMRDFIFEMNDWLLAHQQWGGSLERDYWGRFYSPQKPSYGPPHASATGVYMEGLVDALGLAQEIGDEVRTGLYRQAIERGIRSLAQLQFRDEVDAYYVSRKERVIGAIRTESDNNEIRIDNLQHGLMALLKYRQLCRDKDYSHARRIVAAPALQLSTD